MYIYISNIEIYTRNTRALKRALDFLSGPLIQYIHCASIANRSVDSTRNANVRADETCGQTNERKRKMASISGSSINSRESSRPLGVVRHFGIQCMALRPRIACRLDWTCRTERLGVSTLGGVDVSHWDWAAQSVHTRGTGRAALGGSRCPHPVERKCRTGRPQMSTLGGLDGPHVG